MINAYIPQITFLRFIAARAVFLVHYGAAAFDVEKYILTSFLGELNYAVTFFFVLSGFLLFVRYSESSLSAFNFYVNRFARLYPAYLIALLAFSLPLFFHPKYYGFWGDFFLSLFMLQSWWSDRAQSLNFPAWSLSVEALFYLSFPLLYWIFKRARPVFLYAWVFLFWIVSQVIYYLWFGENLRMFFPLTHMSSFIIGMSGGCFYVYLRKNLQIKYAGLLSVLSLILLCVVNSFESIKHLGHAGLTAPLFAMFLVFFSSGQNFFTALFSRKGFVFLGNISYAMYIFHIPVEIYFYKLFSGYLIVRSPLYSHVYFLFLILFSALFYLYVENPLRKKIKDTILKKRGWC